MACVYLERHPFRGFEDGSLYRTNGKECRLTPKQRVLASQPTRNHAHDDVQHVCAPNLSHAEHTRTGAATSPAQVPGPRQHGTHKTHCESRTAAALATPMQRRTRQRDRAVLTSTAKPGATTAGTVEYHGKYSCAITGAKTNPVPALTQKDISPFTPVRSAS